jgi:nitroreductase
MLPVLVLQPCLDVIRAHVSIRRYLDEKLPEEHVRAIVEAARRAPSSRNLQPVTLTLVEDGEKRKAIAEAVGGQDHVARAPLFIVFSVDYNKLLRAARALGIEDARPTFAHLMIGLIDVSIAASWAALAAESLGYGTVFIAVYLDPCRIAEILNLPDHVLPVLGLCVGKPAERPPQKPRQELSVLMGRDGYPAIDDNAVKRLIEVHGEKASKLYALVLGKRSPYEQLSEKLLECARRRGFNV